MAAKHGPDMRVAEVGGDVGPAAEGIARARLIGYFEMGVHEEEFEGKPRDREKVALEFELSGPNHEPRKLDDGTLIPTRITVFETLSRNEKAHFYKLFAAMNYAGKATHMAELLGEPFIVEVFHRKSKDGKRVFANLRGPNGYNVRGTTVQDPLTGKPMLVPVDPPITEIKAFIWNIADKAMWDSIHIPGVYEEKKDAQGNVTSPAKSKNRLQEKIMQAKNWAEHPLKAVVDAGGAGWI